MSAQALLARPASEKPGPREMEKIVAEGDLDGFAAAAVLVEAFGLPVEFPHPRSLRGARLRRVISVELPPSKVAAISESYLVDHHELVGVYWFPAEGEPSLVHAGGGRSALEVAAKWTGVYPPRDVLDFVNAVDSEPSRVIRDPRYIGYRLLIREQWWRGLAEHGVPGISEALDVFRTVGEVALGAEDEARPETRELPHVLAFIKKPLVKEVEALGRRLRIDLGDYYGRAAMIEAEEYTDKPVVAYVYVDRGATAVSLAPSKRYLGKIDVSQVARELAAALGGTGGGRPTIAGAQLPVADIDGVLGALDGVVARVLAARRL